MAGKEGRTSDAATSVVASPCRYEPPSPIRKIDEFFPLRHRLSRIHTHVTPKVGNVTLYGLRPVDVRNLYTSWRTAGVAESTVRWMYAILHAALTHAAR